MDTATLFSTPLRELSSADGLERLNLSCSFAYPGTYGHECGKRATLVGPRKSDLTVSGIYWVRRCPDCATIHGGENIGVGPFVPFNPALHRNEWR